MEYLIGFVPYAATSLPSAALSRIVNVEPFSSTIFISLNSDRVRVIDSRHVPMSWPISSCVRASLVRITPLAMSPSADVSNKNLASLSEIECDSPTERATSQAS